MEKNDNFNVMRINFYHDCQSFLRNNFIDGYKGYIPFIGFFIYKVCVRFPGRKFLKNNDSVPMRYFNKNILIKVKPIFNHNYDKIDENVNKLVLNFKHIPSFRLFQNYFNKNQNESRNNT